MSLISSHNIYNVIHHCGYCFYNCDWYKKEKHKLFPKERMTTCMGRLTKSLKTKWEIIKHDVNKFVGTSNSVEVLCEFETNAKDILQKPLKLYKMKH